MLGFLLVLAIYQLNINHFISCSCSTECHDSQRLFSSAVPHLRDVGPLHSQSLDHRQRQRNVQGARQGDLVGTNAHGAQVLRPKLTRWKFRKPIVIYPPIVLKKKKKQVQEHPRTRRLKLPPDGSALFSSGLLSSALPWRFHPTRFQLEESRTPAPGHPGHFSTGAIPRHQKKHIEFLEVQKDETGGVRQPWKCFKMMFQLSLALDDQIQPPPGENLCSQPGS